MISRAYALWLSAQSGVAFRLPSEAEWEAAARGREARLCSYGNEFESEDVWFGRRAGLSVRQVVQFIPPSRRGWPRSDPGESPERIPESVALPSPAVGVGFHWDRILVHSRQQYWWDP